MKFKAQTAKTARLAGAAAVFAAAGAVTGLGVQSAQHSPDNAPPAVAESVFQDYETKLQKMRQKQLALDSTNDEKSAEELIQQKQRFVADVLFDTTLTAQKSLTLGLSFNALAGDDSIGFHAYAEKTETALHRNECQEETVLTGNPAASITRIETCMTAHAERDGETRRKALLMGGLMGLGIFGAYRFGAKMRPEAPRV